MSPAKPNPEVIRATYRWLAHQGHGVSEVRAIQPGKGILGIGFFDDEDAFVRECIRTNAIANVYVGIQPRPRRLLDKATNAIRPLKRGAGIKDIEVVTATVIDLDPERPKDTASTQTELDAALGAAGKAAEWCAEQGFTPPEIMMSGNGAQLWCALPPTPLTDNNREAVQRGLKAYEAEVRGEAETQGVKVDSIHDLSRIIKVIGTVSRKGEHTDERPHRVSAPLNGQVRNEDAALLQRLLSTPPEPEPKPSSLPLGTGTAAPTSGCNGCARRTEDGCLDFREPVEMCGPIRELWHEGAEDRSLAIFNMVLYFAHKGLPLEEITELVIEYDRRGLGKLRGRNAEAYIKNCYDKAVAGVREDGTIAPPCHSLQRLGLCKVNVEPTARCDLYDFVFDIEQSIEQIPEDAPARDLERRLRSVLEAISGRDSSVHGKYLGLIEKRFGLKARDLRRSLNQIKQSKPEPAGGDDAEDTREVIEGEIYEDTCFYYTINGRGDSKTVSSFTITPTMRVNTEQGEIIFGDARTDNGKTVKGLRLPLRAFHSKRDLIKHMPSADMQWTGSDNNVQGLLRILARRPVPEKPGSMMLGYYGKWEEPIWLTPNGAITRDGFVDPAPVIYIPNGGSLAGRIVYDHADDEVFEEVARAVFEHLPRTNAPEVILPVLGWFFASPMKPHFMGTGGTFPMLFVWGTQGSGKSSICIDIFWPLFGVVSSDPYSATETEFALLKLLTSTRSVPVFIDEYKPYDMQKRRVNTLHRYLRRLYRGEVEERGRPDQTVNTYHLQAPVCVAGETRPNEAAILERIVTANPEKVTLDDHPEYKAAYRALKRVNLSVFAPRYIAFCLKRDFKDDVAVAKELTAQILGDRDPPDRVKDNLMAMVMGVYLFEEFAAYCGLSELVGDLDIHRAVDAVLEDVVETDHGVKNAFDQFVEMLVVMAIQGELRHRTHYVFKDGIFYLHLESAYDTFRQHCKRIDYEGEVVDIKALKRMIRENRKQGGYVIEEGTRVYFGTNSNRRRAVGMDLSKTKLICAEDFPQESDTTGFMGGWRGYDD